MLKQSSESQFNSLMAAAFPYPLPPALDCQHSPADARGRLTLAGIYPKRKVMGGRTGLARSRTPAAQTSRSSPELSSSRETATFKYSSSGEGSFCCHSHVQFQTILSQSHYENSEPHIRYRNLYPLDAKKHRGTHCSRLACPAIRAQDSQTISTALDSGFLTTQPGTRTDLPSDHLQLL